MSSIQPGAGANRPGERVRLVSPAFPVESSPAPAFRFRGWWQSARERWRWMCPAIMLFYVALTVAACIPTGIVWSARGVSSTSGVVTDTSIGEFEWYKRATNPWRGGNEASVSGGARQHVPRNAFLMDGGFSVVITYTFNVSADVPAVRRDISIATAGTTTTTTTYWGSVHRHERTLDEATHVVEDEYSVGAGCTVFYWQANPNISSLTSMDVMEAVNPAAYYTMCTFLGLGGIFYCFGLTMWCMRCLGASLASA